MIELQIAVQLANPSSKNLSEGSEVVQQSKTTIEQPAHTPTRNEESATRKPWHPRNSGGYQEKQNFMPYHTYPHPWNPQTS
ncbi:unnamed protein product [Adineta steineri]|uniref:Uncharacterized protein n=1 Tax=Adineta steineri TaxID=433720 RepID=A0A819Y3P7_9BILA|nr:unnamed protein product [Adineta steineri]